MKNGWINLGAVCVVLVASATVHAEITWHNGSDDGNLSYPLGSGDVNVGVIADDDLAFLEKDYYEIATLELNYDFEGGQPPVVLEEYVYNLTAPPEGWASFTVTLELATFYGIGEGGITPLSGDITIEDVNLQHLDATYFDNSELSAPISITSVGDVTTMFIDFATPIAYGDGFSLAYEIGVNCSGPSPCGDGFIMTETPTAATVIPAPGAALLAAIGLGFVGRIRRRSN